MKLEDIKITDEEMDDYFLILEKREQRLQKRVNSIRRFLSSKSDSDIEKIIIRFLEWEQEYEERFRKKGILTTSKLFYAVMEYCETHGKKHDIDGDFLTTSTLWGDYEINLYCGQGCFYRVIKNNEIIFQST